MSDTPRSLTADEIERIVSLLDPGHVFDSEIHESLTAAHRENIRRQLVRAKVRPSKIGRLTELIRAKYQQALVKPGSMRGLIAVHSVVQPIYQASLNAFHAAGSLLKITDIIKLVEVIINANKSIPFAISTINVNRLFEDFDLYIRLRQDLLEVRFKDLIVDTEIYNFGEAVNVIRQTMNYYRLMREHYADWNEEEDLDPTNALMRIKLDRHLLYIKRLTPFRLAMNLDTKSTNRETYIFPSPVSIDEPFIDVIIPQSVNRSILSSVQLVAKSEGCNTIGTQNAAVIFFNTIILPKWEQEIVAGVPGAHEISVQKVNFGNAIVESVPITDDQYQVKVRNYHFSNRLVDVEEIFRLYFPDAKLVEDEYGFKTLTLTSSTEPKEVMSQMPYSYGLIKTHQHKAETYTTVDFNYLVSYDYIIPERCGTTNFYYVRDRLGIQACQNNIVHSFTNIISDQSPNTYPENSVLVANYICVRGDLIPYTFAGYSRHEVGPIASAAFQDPFKAIWMHSLGYRQGTTSVDAGILAGVRPEIGTEYTTKREPLPKSEVDFQEVVKELTGQKREVRFDDVPAKETVSAPPTSSQRLGRLAVRTLGGAAESKTTRPLPSTALRRVAETLTTKETVIPQVVQSSTVMIQSSNPIMGDIAYTKEQIPVSTLFRFYAGTL